MENFEIWRDIPGLIGKCMVSNQERFLNLDYKNTGKPKFYSKEDMIQPKTNHPYYKVSIGRVNAYFHELVAMSFPEICGVYYDGCEVHHKNHNKLDNRPENLKIMSIKEHRALHPKTDEEKERKRRLYTGEGNPFYGKHHTAETIAKMSEQRKGKEAWNKGKKMSDEYRKKNSESHMGKGVGEKNGMYGKHRTDEEKEVLRKAHSKPVIQFTLDGSFIRRWNSAKEAMDALGINNLRKCADGHYKSAGGYYWKYEHLLTDLEKQTISPLL